MSRNRSRSRISRRDVNIIANRRLPTDLSLPRSIQAVLNRRLSLSLIEDRRVFHPDGLARPARSLYRRRPRLRVIQPRLERRSKNVTSRLARSSTPSFFAFADAPRVAVCVRRKVRQEVLHALKKTGSKGQRRPRRSFTSSIVC